MDLQQFTAALARMSAVELHEVAVVLHTRSGSAADEVDAWRVTLTIDRVLRAAETQGIELPDAEVTHVARSAAEVARGMVAGPAVAGEVRTLLGPWTPLVGAPA